MSNILRKIFDRQQARVKEPTLPEQLREQALKQAEGFYSVSQFGMEHMSDGTFAVYPTGVQESPTDGTFTLTVIYSSPGEVYYPPQDKLFNHRLACLLGTYITHHTDKPAGIHETHNERRYKRRTPQALDGLKFARCLMIPRHQLLAEWERTWRTENFWKFNLADAFGIDVMWLEVRARELNLLHPSGKSFRTPTPVPIET